MTEQAKQVMDPNSVRKVVNVQAPQAGAWKVFTEQMGSWWPLSMSQDRQGQRCGRHHRAARGRPLVRAR